MASEVEVKREHDFVILKFSGEQATKAIEELRAIYESIDTRSLEHILGEKLARQIDKLINLVKILVRPLTDGANLYMPVHALKQALSLDTSHALLLIIQEIDTLIKEFRAKFRELLDRWFDSGGSDENALVEAVTAVDTVNTILSILLTVIPLSRLTFLSLRSLGTSPLIRSSLWNWKVGYEAFRPTRLDIEIERLVRKETEKQAQPQQK